MSGSSQTTSSTADLSIGREAVYGYAAQMSKLAVTLTSTILFAKWFGVTGLGTYVFLFSAAKLFGRSSMGFGEAVKKRLSEVGTDNAQFFGGGLLLQGIFLGLCALGTVVVYWFDPTVLNTSEYVIGFFGMLAGYSLIEFSREAYAGSGEPGRAMWLDPLSQFAAFIFQLTFIWHGWSEFGMVAGLGAGLISTALLGFVLTGIRPTIPTRETLQYIWEFARWSLPGEFISNLYRLSDTLAIGLLVGSAAVGHFEGAARLVMIGTFVGGAIAKPLMVKSSGLDSLGKPINGHLAAAIGYAGILSIPAFFLLAVFPDAVMRLVFGADFQNTGLALILVAAYSAVAVYRGQFTGAFHGTDRPNVVTTVRTIMGVSYIPIVYLLGTMYALNGVLFGALLVELLGFGLYSTLAKREFGSVIKLRPFAAQIGASLIAAGGVYLAHLSYEPTSLIRIFALLGLGVLIYAPLVTLATPQIRAFVSTQMNKLTVARTEKSG